ncbi:MAG: hypothetical protein MI807_02695, partial [Verrucomicrobiales bacterium]|nr:hypothetical protein [Verrucomicrobiales bacterium]
YAQVGHGGAGANGSAEGDIFLNVDPHTHAPGSGVDVSLVAGTGAGSYAQVGHGGVGAAGNKTGNIAIDSSGDLKVTAGAEDLAYALIGHGGVEADGFLDGGISLDVGGNIDLAGGGTAGDSSDGEMNFAMIGHSLEGARGGFGNLVEEGGLIVGEAEWFNATDNWVVRPEGYYPVGWTGSPAPPAHTFSGSRNGYFLELPDGNPAGAASSNSYVHYTFTTGSSGGSYRLNMRWTGFNGNSDSLFADIVEVKDGAGGEADYYNFASTTGGFGTFGWHSGATTEASSGGDSSNPPVWNLAANTTYTLRINPREDGVAVDSWMLVNNATGTFNGDAGVTFANKSGIGGGDISVNSGGNITVNSGINSDAFAAIGHGGSSHQTPGGLSYGSASDGADVFVHADGGIVLDAGANPGDTAGASNRYAVIGHHGVDADFEAFGNVTVEAGAGGVRMSSGNAVDSFAQIGHASNRESGGGTALSRQGDVSVSTTGVIEMLAGSFDGGHAQIGHGGSRVSGVKAGSVDVIANGLSLIAGSGVSSYAQIGHGGEESVGDMSGDVVFSVDGSVDISAGDGNGAYAMIGHGGGSSSGDQDGRIQVSSDDLRIAGGTGERSAAQIGHGGNSSSGAKSGDVDVTAESVDILAGSGDFARAAIGHGGNSGVGDISGEVDVDATVGGIIMRSADGRSSGTQIGHGGSGYGGSVVGQAVTVFSQNGLTMTGGDGLSSSSQIGHGGAIANSPELSGAVNVTAGGDVSLMSGSEIHSFTQIGNGGSSVDGDFSGEVTLESGGAIVLSSNGTTGAYSKIGHGDDLGAPALSGTGDRSGNIEVSADSDVTMTDAMIGHVNATSNSTSSGGSTQIGVAGSAPADQTAGVMIADADSEFHGQDGLRFYLPRRGNNQISAGATLNGVSFEGAETDPSETQRIDEFTINILGDQILFPNEHANVFGTGPAPQNPGNFAFYYDTIVLVDLPEPSGSETPGSATLTPLILPFFDLLFPDDRTTDDWQRKRRKDFTSYKSWSTYYEGFEQYGLYGDSIFSAGLENNPDSEEEGF